WIDRNRNGVAVGEDDGQWYARRLNQYLVEVERGGLAGEPAENAAAAQADSQGSAATTGVGDGQGRFARFDRHRTKLQGYSPRFARRQHHPIGTGAGKINLVIAIRIDGSDRGRAEDNRHALGSL